MGGVSTAQTPGIPRQCRSDSGHSIWHLHPAPWVFPWILPLSPGRARHAFWLPHPLKKKLKNFIVCTVFSRWQLKRLFTRSGSFEGRNLWRVTNVLTWARRAGPPWPTRFTCSSDLVPASVRLKKQKSKRSSSLTVRNFTQFLFVLELNLQCPSRQNSVS